MLRTGQSDGCPKMCLAPCRASDGGGGDCQVKKKRESLFINGVSRNIQSINQTITKMESKASHNGLINVELFQIIKNN